jgi:UDP-N-acetylglucosamine acyltransferase
VDPRAHLGDDVEVGPGCIIEPDVEIGAGTVLREYAIIRRYTTLGRGNYVDTGCVLGGLPQDLKFSPQTVTYLKIGDNNVFRERVTISRATKPGGATTVGSGTYWMESSHAGHDSAVHDGAILVNGSALAGHTVLERKATISAHTGIHQFCWVGEMSFGQGNSACTQHVPPFVMWAGRNQVIGLNVVGMRRAGLSAQDRAEVKEAFSILYRRGLPMNKVLEVMDQCKDWAPAAASFRQFVRRVHQAARPFNRGLMRARHETILTDE